ncbi:MAG: hypothetical protein ABFD54_04545 [Armatimonadota bacterium]
MKFRKLPVVIEAVQYTGPVTPNCIDQELALFLDEAVMSFSSEGGGRLLIHTLEGTHEATPGDWIIKGVNGEFYPCKPDIFEKTYEAVEEE